MTEAVAARPAHSTEPVRPLVLAAVFLSSLRIAMRMWIEEELAREPIEVTDEILDEIGRSFA